MVLALLHAQGSDPDRWELVRAFEEITFPVQRSGISVFPAGGFDFDSEGNILLYEVQQGLFHRYSETSDFAERETTEVRAFDGGSVNEARWVDDWIFYHGGPVAYGIELGGEGPGATILIDLLSIRQRHIGFGFPIPVGNLILRDGPGGYHSIEVQFEDPHREPEYRDAAATRELIEERGEELGLYYDSRGYLWARDEPHDWLVTSNPETFNEAFGLPRRGGAAIEFAGRDREGNYYWGSPYLYIVFAPDGRMIAEVRPEDPDLSGSMTAMRVNLDGELMFFGYGRSTKDPDLTTMSLYRLDTGIITGR
jgi:hypothetical protein